MKHNIYKEDYFISITLGKERKFFKRRKETFLKNEQVFFIVC